MNLLPIAHRLMKYNKKWEEPVCHSQNPLTDVYLWPVCSEGSFMKGWLWLTVWGNTGHHSRDAAQLFLLCIQSRTPSQGISAALNRVGLPISLIQTSLETPSSQADIEDWPLQQVVTHTWLSFPWFPASAGRVTWMSWARGYRGCSQVISVFVLVGWPDACGWIRYPLILFCIMCFLTAVIASF